MTKLRPLILALCALLAVVPAADAKKRPRPAPKYYFSASHTRTVVTVSTCDAIPSGQTTETVTATIQTEQRGYLGGAMTSSGWRQESIKRETKGNDYLPPYEYVGPREELGKTKGKASESWKVGSSTARYLYWAAGDGAYVPLKLPRPNRETTRTFDGGTKDSDEYDPQSRCAHAERITVTGNVTLQRVR
jgi:hypothetical protein